MDSSTSIKKPKLPRKRKKAAIKAQGRKWYYDTIKLHYILAEKGQAEKVCKFWRNDSIKPRTYMVQGAPRLIPVATRFW